MKVFSVIGMIGLGLALFVGIAGAQTSTIATTTTATTTTSTTSTVATTTPTSTTPTSTVATSTASSTPSSTVPSVFHVMIMKHLCNANVKNLEDFTALASGLTPPQAIANAVFNCPTTGLPGNDAATGTLAAPRSTFDFSVSSNGATKMLAANGSFAQGKLCENAINFDFNKDGSVSSSTCLDTSNYDISVSTSSPAITVMETKPPAGYAFGALRFTPSEIDGNNDATDLVSINSTGTINLNMASDTDGSVMLHIYNFLTSTTTSTSTTSTRRHQRQRQRPHRLRRQRQHRHQRQQQRQAQRRAPAARLQRQPQRLRS